MILSAYRMKKKKPAGYILQVVFMDERNVMGEVRSTKKTALDRLSLNYIKAAYFSIGYKRK